MNKIQKFKRWISWRELKKIGFWRTVGRLAITGFIILALLFVWYSKDLPTPARIAQKINLPSTQILDRNGQLLYAVSQNKKRLVIPFSEMPADVKNATIAVEDQNFYKHYGIDFKGVARSFLVDLTRGGASQGGSTITQQFVKNALLDSKKTFSRKIKELILSVEIEAIYPKDKILELYLNEIPYGSTAYGIESAARTYFGKSTKDLNLAEAATLASLPQAPSRYSPYGPNKETLLKRKDYVLDRMEKLGYISADQSAEAKKQTITFQPRKDSILAPHFVFYVQSLIAEKYGEELLQNGGLKITTSLDIETQKKAEQAIDDGTKKLDKYGANNAALVSVEPKTGQIIAMVGSKDYFNQDIQGQVNVTTSNRQPGSSFKPIVYATAFKDKYNPAYPLFDLTTDFGGGYTPSNYDGNTHGPVSMRTALSNSLNIPAVKTLGLVGVKNAIATASDLGISTLTKPDRYGLALVLGGGEVKPLEMAGAFSAFGNNGQFNAPTAILKVEDQKGAILEEYKNPPQKQVLDPQVAFLISNILSDTEARKMIFGFTNALTIPSHQVAVKTGTTSEYHDAWTVGYSPQISTAVWVGNTDNTAMKKGADGSVVAAPIWNAFMRKYLADLPNEDFVRPDGVKQVEVDLLSNQLRTEASPEADKRFDWFASWNAPTEKDNIHVKVKINKLNVKLATDQTPAELIEEKTYTNIHSEKPTFASWEGPVREWARQNGIDNLPPTDQDNSYTLQDKPVVIISAPKDNATITGDLTIQTDASAKYGIKEISFAIDNTVLTTDNQSPYSATITAGKITDGNHKLTVIATDSNGATGSQTISLVFNTNIDNIGPVVTSSATTTVSSATIAWTTNEPAQGFIEYGLTSSLGGSSVNETSLATNHSTSIGGLNSGTTYYYRVIAKDKNSNQTTTPTISFVTK